MSKFKNRLMKRVMAVILSGAMVMSSMTLPGATAYAAEAEEDTGGGYSEALSEDEELKAEEADNKDEALEQAEADNRAEVSEQAEGSGSSAPDEGDGSGSGTGTGDKTEPSKAPDTTDESTATEKTSDTTEETLSQPQSSTAETQSTESPGSEGSSDEGSSDEGSSSEETSDVGGSSEESEVYSSGTIDLTGGLSAKKTYGDSLVKVTVLEDMEYKIAEEPLVIGEASYPGYVKGVVEGSNPSPDKGAVPTKGAAFKITALQPAEIIFAVKATKDKKCHFVWDSKTGAVSIAPSSADVEADQPLPENGAYKYKMNEAGTYYFYASASKIEVYDIKWQEKQPRPTWDTIANPVIQDVALDEKDASKINVTIKAPIGEDGADKVAVYMYEAAEDAASGESQESGESSEASASEENAEAVASAESVKPGEETVLTFSPKKSGTYQFQAEISRNDEPGAAPKKSAMSEKFAYTLVEAAREWKFLAYGNGVSKPEDNAKYDVNEENGTVKLDVETGKIVPASNDGLAFYYTTVPSDKNFTFTANAHVDKWTFSNGQEGFGIMAADNIGPTGSRIWNNSYQAVVSRISYKWNGVEISEDGTGESIDMQIGVGSTEKVGVTQDDIDAFNANEIGQPLQFRAEQKALDTTYAKFGMGQFNIVANYTNGEVEGSLGKGHVLFEDFWLQIKKDNTGYAVSYAPYVCEKDSEGNYVTDEEGDEKGKAKYILDENGNKVVDTDKMITQQYYDTDALSVLDKDNVYVGVFASRHAHILFSDMDLDVRNVADDPDPAPRKKKLINLSRNVLSGTLTNTPEYTFMFASNWKGKLYVKNGAGEYLSRHKLTDEKGQPILDKDGKEQVVDYYDVNGTLDPEVQYCQDGDDAKDTKVRIPIPDLSVGQNALTIEYVPAPEGSWPEVEEEQAIKLKSYETVRFTHIVEYRKYGDEGATIYVSPHGKAGNNGTQDSPLDIYTAVKYALPGQTLLLEGGRYSLNRTLEIPKTVCGRPAKTDEKGNPIQKDEDYKGYIKMIGDPKDVKDGKRPVLDFNSLVAAVVAVGDFWYFKDFDVIRCKYGEKGIQVSGSYCVYDQVNTYRNGSTGLQICRASGTDTYSDWPKYNTILNCNSYLNADIGFEDADGFAAKLTSGSGNVFDGCIAAFNADDGWDLFAKAQTGSIGGVIIRNSIAYRNGYILTKDGTVDGEISEDGICVKGAGNGNGFKMGGDGLRAGSEADEDYGKDKESVIPNVGHRLYNSLAFGNKSKGIDSNSAPNIKAYNSISFNNDGANISLDTYDDYIIHTDYELQNVISIRSKDQMAQSEIVEDVQTFKEEGKPDYTTKYALNMMRPASGSSTSACVYLSLKNVQDRAAKVKVWWRSSDPEKDCQMKILSGKNELLAEGDYSRKGELKISELKTKGTEKCYLGSDDGLISIYKVEVTAKRTDKEEEQTWIVDISEKYTKTGKQGLNGKKDIYSNKLDKEGKEGVGITIQYAAVPLDGVEMLGQQKTSPIKDKVENDSTYYYRSSDGMSKNKSGKGLTADDFVSLDYPYLNTVSPEHWRNEDGTINTGDFLKLKPNAGSYPEGNVPSMGGSTSPVDVEELIGDEVNGSISGTTPGEVPTEDFGDDYPEDGIAANDPDDPNGNGKKYYGRVWAAPVKYLDYTYMEPIQYTGKKIQPEIHVYFSADPAPLVLGKDYKVKYTDNLDAGEAKAEIIGVNRYKGFTTEVTFTIHPVSFTLEEGVTNPVAIPAAIAVKTGDDVKKLIKTTWEGKALKEGKDYKIEDVDASKKKVVGMGNFTGERLVNIHNIDNVASEKLLSKAKVKVLDENLTYTGDEIIPNPEDVEVTLNGTPITTGFTLKYANNENVGKATVTAVGDGINYFGSKSATFNIKAGNLKDVAKVVYKSGENKGKDFEVPVEVEFNGSSCAIPVNSFEVKLINDDTIRLKKDVDYKVVQSGGNRAGSASLTIKGINNYKGALPSYKYKVTPLDINDLKVEIIYDKTLDYMANGAKHVPGQNFYIKVNGFIVDKSNYSLSYKDNKVVGTATIKVTGRKLLEGKLKNPLSFTINKANMTDNPDISVSAKDVITSGKDLTIGDLTRANPGLTQLVNGKQKKLAANRDYNKNEIEYYIDMDNDYKLTDKDKLINTADKEKKKEKISEFDAKGYLTILVKIKAADGNYEGEKVGYFRAAKWSIARIKVENLKPRIFGKNWKQASGLSTPITWSDAEVAKIADYIKITHKLDGKGEPAVVNCVDIIGAYTYDTSYFDLDGFAIVPNSYKKNDKVGTASFTIIGTGKYAGTKKVTFKIINKEQAEKGNMWIVTQ